MSHPDMKKIPPANIYEFRQIDQSETVEIPELASYRHCTDILFLIFFVEAIFLTLVIAACTGIINTDYHRFLNGYDKCGDTCGSSNTPIAGINCSGKDLSNKRFIKFQLMEKKNVSAPNVKDFIIPDECVNKCESPNRLLFQRCMPPADVQIRNKDTYILGYVEFIEDFKNSSVILIIPMVVTGLVLSVSIFYAFSWSSRITVVLILTFSLTAMCLFGATIWYFFSIDDKNRTLLIVCILVTIGFFFLTMFMCYFHNQYSLAIQMFAEVSQATLQMPGLVLLGFLALIYLTISITGTIFLVFLVSTSGIIQKNPDFDVYEYQQTSLSQFSITYLLLVLLWNVAFINGCQCIVVAGAITSYYFQRNKSELTCPVFKSLCVLIRFHLGTAAFGSLCTTILTLARVVFEFFSEHIKCECAFKCMDYALTFLEEIVECLTRRSYVQTAMHGTPLYKSGVRAARLMWANLLDSISLEIVSDFITLCAIILTILISAGVAAAIYYGLGMNFEYFTSILLIGAGICGFTIYFYMQIINVALETIFICFCEDKLLNDNKTRPYFMSERLKTLIDRAKQEAKRREDN